ncbi:amino acid adenylation domain-containing protein [Streptomyces sp. NPDC050548]|uniref:amino acid adenylation domain-containing protein n=1 Tax=Streptomyces sp. NPDC050548 TaxID=3365629 RepID=UPI003789E9BD
MSARSAGRPGCLHHLLRAAAAAHPLRTAVVDGPRVLTYAELDAWSDRVAARLRTTGVEPGDRVGLFLDKSAEAIAGLYGVLKAGACYVPLDPQAPAARLRMIAEDCALSALLTGRRRNASTAPDDIAHPKGLIDLGGDLRAGDTRDAGASCDVPETVVGPDDLAYILYTSGSTGRPKGVTLTHGNGLAFVRWAADEFRLAPDDRLSSHAPLHFDLSVLDVFGAAAGAAALVLVPPQASVFPVQLARFIRELELTVWYSVPSVLSLLLRHGEMGENPFPDLRLVLFAGEVFPTPHLRRLMTVLPRARMVNLYGPTETNVCTWHEVTRPPETDAPVPIGRALPGTETVAVTGDGRPAAPGETGELLVGGPTVMRGYWNDPERTDRVLVPSPLAPAGGDRPRVYRTGDLVTVGADGAYTFVGRRDHQVKTRGYRVELAEIEAALHTHPAVVECAVVAVPDELVTNRLVACLVATEEIDAREVARVCRSRLPRYMIPDRFEFFDRLPRTSTDKTDRRALLEQLERLGRLANRSVPPVGVGSD